MTTIFSSPLVARGVAAVLFAAAAAFAPAAVAQGIKPPAPQATAPAPAPATAAVRNSTSLDKVTPIDRVVAIVNDEALTQYDINEQKRVVLGQMKTANLTPPSPDVLEKQVLERLITERVLLQYAKDTGIRVDDTQVERTLAHILVLVPEQASPDQIDVRQRRAEQALSQVRSGTDFGQVAAGFSDAPDALQGGALGWRTPARLPTVFADSVRKMKAGDVSPVLRSASGFHIVKLLETRSRNNPTVIEQTKLRHILVKVNETVSNDDARVKIERIRERIQQGAKFEDQAKANSEDASAAKGGDLGWVSPGDTVPDFERAMNALKPSELSAAVRTPFGWHLIQVQERRTQDITREKARDQARAALRQRKSEEAFQDWVRQTRDRSYVEIRVDER